MTYIDGFLIAVPTANKAAFIEHARAVDQLIVAQGARRIVEGWGEGVPHGKVTDFYRAVAATEDETVAFSWIEWTDKAAREAGMAGMQREFETNPLFEHTPMPFDGQRMVFGGFEAIVEEGAGSNEAWMQGFVIPVHEGQREAYRTMATEVWPMFEKYGALRVIEAYGDDVPEGKQTDFYRAVNAAPGEGVVFSFLEWPSRETCDAAAEAMMNDPDMKMPETMPFDPQRMIYAGFRPVVTLGEPA